MAKMIGNGTTVALSVDGSVAGVQSCEMPNFAGDDVEVTDLDSSQWREFIGNGLSDTGEVAVEIFQDATGSGPSQGIVQTITIVNTDGTATRTLTGSGYVREWSMGNASPGEAIVGSMVFKFDGIGTPPGISLAP
jgi:hypothetical protein